MQVAAVADFLRPACYPKPLSSGMIAVPSRLDICKTLQGLCSVGHARRRVVGLQEYDYHLAAVNTITFVDEGRRFMTTSDDKTIRFWEMGINVQVLARATAPQTCQSYGIVVSYLRRCQGERQCSMRCR